MFDSLIYSLATLSPLEIVGFTPAGGVRVCFDKRYIACYPKSYVGGLASGLCPSCGFRRGEHR